MGGTSWGLDSDLHQAEAGQIFLTGRIFLLNTDAEPRVRFFSLLSSIINASREMLGMWGCLPAPPSRTPDEFSGWTMRLTAQDVLKGQRQHSGT